ncbi:MAG: NUDIX hydrolase [Azoarcus sp.]|jgi:ADP-ribose pyrophosphatase|nr:NUDIX hydrolase [Azoarcus sp.]
MSSVEKPNDPLQETCLQARRVFDGILLKVDRDRVRLPDGREVLREYIRHPGAVAVIAQHADGRIIFERQFRHPLRRAFLELPAGKIDPGEEPLAAARRELREETGFKAADWRRLGVMHPCIGYSDEHIEIFLARGLHETGQQWDEGEFLELLAFTPGEAVTAIRDGRITDGKTITALFLALPFLS